LRLEFQRYRAENVFGSLISGDTAENVFGSLISMRLDHRSYQSNLPQPKEFFPSTMFEIFSSVLAYRFFDLFVGCGVFSLCNLLLSPFLCLNCFTNTLEYYRKNYRFRKAQN
jgi:hypothetical protein